MLALLRLLLLHLLLFFRLMLSLMLLLLLLLAFLLLLRLWMLVLMLQQSRTLLGLGGGPRDSNTTPTPAAAGARQAARPRAPHLGTLAHSMSKHPGGPVAPDICFVPSLNTDNVRDAWWMRSRWSAVLEKQASYSLSLSSIALYNDSILLSLLIFRVADVTRNALEIRSRHWHESKYPLRSEKKTAADILVPWTSSALSAAQSALEVLNLCATNGCPVQVGLLI